MTQLNPTEHAMIRQSQRGFKADDFKQIAQHGTPVGDMEILLTDKDVQHAISARKREIQALERLKNRLIVVDGQTVITAYRLDKKKQRSRLRRARHSGW